MLEVGPGFPRWKAEPSMEAGHALRSKKVLSPWGARPGQTREPKEVFLGLKDAGPGDGQCPAQRLRPPGRAGRIWTFRSIFNFPGTRGWGEGGREILLPSGPTSFCLVSPALGLVRSVDTSPEVSSGPV